MRIRILANSKRKINEKEVMIEDIDNEDFDDEE